MQTYDADHHLSLRIMVMNKQLGINKMMQGFKFVMSGEIAACLGADVKSPIYKKKIKAIFNRIITNNSS